MPDPTSTPFDLDSTILLTPSRVHVAPASTPCSPDAGRGGVFSPQVSESVSDQSLKVSRPWGPIADVSGNPLYEIWQALGIQGVSSVLDLLDRDFLPVVLNLANRDYRVAPFVHLILSKCKYISKNPDLPIYTIRNALTALFSYGIPHPLAIQAISKISSHILEIGAGTGYWSALLSHAGCQVTAYDNGNWKIHPLYLRVLRGGAIKVKDSSADTLLLCWPPFDNRMAYDALRYFKGQYVVYVGEGCGGCTGSAKFHELLESDWDNHMSLPSIHWPGLHDRATIYERRT